MTAGSRPTYHLSAFHDDLAGRARGTAPRLAVNVAWAAVGNVGYAACQWGVLVVLTKLTNAAEVGHFALGLAITAPVMIGASLLLRTVEATDALTEHPFGVYLGLRIVTTTLALIAIGAIGLAAGYRGPTLVVIYLIGFAKAFESLSDIVFGLLQKLEDLRRIALSMLWKGSLSLAGMASTLWWTRSVPLATLAMAGVWALLLLAYDLPAARRLDGCRPILRDQALLRLAWLALPMGVAAALQSLITNVPRYAIESILGASALGHFAALAYLILAGNQPVMALWAAASPRLAQYFVADLAAYRRLSSRTVAIAAAIGGAVVLGVALIGTRILSIVYAPEYAAHGRVLLWLAVWAATGYVASAFGCAVSAARRFREQLGVTALALVACVLASRLLVPRYGLDGAAWALVLATIVQVAGLAAIYVAACAARTRATGYADAPSDVIARAAGGAMT